MEAKKTVQTVGRRKTAIARVKVVPGNGKISVNGKEVKDYFTVPRMMSHAIEGLTVANAQDKYDIKIRVTGGGIGGQAGAVRLGLARALQEFDPSVRPELKKDGHFTRDPRMVERKKYGLHKARRGTQFSKR